MIKLCILKMARQFVENLGRGIHKKRVNDSKIYLIKRTIRFVSPCTNGVLFK